MELDQRFSQEELTAIRTAVREAEQRTSGELVTYLVGRCDEYPESALRAGVVGGSLAVVCSMLVFLLDPLRVSFLGGPLLGPGALWLAILSPLIVGPLCALLCTLSDPVQRLFLNRADVARRVQLRAEAAFLEEQVFATRDRTGLLIFLALFEHRALVLADEGIASKVEQSVWDGIVKDLCRGMRRGEDVPALVGAIEACAGVLERHGVKRRADDAEELSNAPRLRER